jgi:hypothetical protein|nr:MAG TPA: hypothetical protein [Caudoviricetes sp.]
MNIKEFCDLNNLTLDEIFEMLPVEFDFQNWFENVYWPQVGSATGFEFWENSQNNTSGFVYMMKAFFTDRLGFFDDIENLTDYLDDNGYSEFDFVFESLVILKDLGMVNIQKLMNIYQQILNNAINSTY